MRATVKKIKPMTLAKDNDDWFYFVKEMTCLVGVEVEVEHYREYEDWFVLSSCVSFDWMTPITSRWVFHRSWLVFPKQG